MKFENTSVYNIYNAILGARNPMNSWNRSDSTFKGFNGKIENVESIWKVMWSKTLRWFYLIPLVIVIIVFIFEYWSFLCTIIPRCSCK